jgi:hypothetical protein
MASLIMNGAQLIESLLVIWLSHLNKWIVHSCWSMPAALVLCPTYNARALLYMRQPACGSMCYHSGQPAQA